MKLMVPQLDLDQQKGFAADIDIFKRMKPIKMISN